MAAWKTRVLWIVGLSALIAAETRFTVVPDVSQANSLIGEFGNCTTGLKGPLVLPTVGTTVKLTCIANISGSTWPPQIIWLKDHAVLQSEPNWHLDTKIYASNLSTSDGLSLRSTLQFIARDKNYSGRYTCWADQSGNATFNVRVMDKVRRIGKVDEDAVCDGKEIFLCAVRNGFDYDFLQLNPGTQQKANFAYCASNFYTNSTYQASVAKVDPSVASVIVWPEEDGKTLELSRCVMARKANLERIIAAVERCMEFKQFNRTFNLASIGVLAAVALCVAVLYFISKRKPK